MPLRTFAAVLFASGFAASASAQSTELSVRTGLGYSSYSGIHYDLGLQADFWISNRWQLGGGVEYTGNTTWGIYNRLYRFGATYNFQDDRYRSYFVGGGVGYATDYPWVDSGPEVFGYVRAGKRFL